LKIQSVTVHNFKRFANLTISSIPESARLVVLAGPNGRGKSSLFDAFFVFQKQLINTSNWDPAYHSRTGEPQNRQDIAVQFYAPPNSDEARKKLFYMRTAYRNDPTLGSSSIPNPGPAVSENRFNKFIDNDAAVVKNYQRIVGNTVLDTFFFGKGAIAQFRYSNLSGGEKSAFDLLLDIVAKRREYDDSIYCIDEPETHINPQVQGRLIAALLGLIPEQCQLWIATHSIGMMRKAIEIEKAGPGAVVFLDFGEKDFDQPVTLTPTQPSRKFWQSALRVALDDIAQLVSPSELIICEGDNVSDSANNDAACYNRIFENEFPEVQFISGGNSEQVALDKVALAKQIPQIVGADVRALIDKDDLGEEEIESLKRDGVSVLGERNIQTYLWSEEVLTKLCQQRGRPEAIAAVLTARTNALAASVGKGNAPNDLKRAAGTMLGDIRRELGIVGGGNTARAFEKETLAPLITPDTETYAQLKKSIFSEPIA